MRRLAGLGVLLLTAAIAVAIAGASAEGSSSYRVDAIFDNARGLIGGQLVKIAGARVGTIQDVVLTPGYKARVEMEIDGRFAPFRSDASCTIRPEGLIAENYVDCSPGTPAGRPLAPSGGHAPTVPVDRTTEPVNLTDLFDVWQAPTRDRFALIVNELGIGLSARGQDLNAILRRANPTLALARRALAIIDRQRSEIGRIVDASDQLIGSLARHSSGVSDFISRAAAVASTTAAHSSSLSAATQRLPRLLAAAQAALASLDTVAVNGTPLVQGLHRAAPSVNDLSSAIVPFAGAARPALASLGRSLVQGTSAVRALTPVVHTLRGYAHASLPNSKLAGRLFTNLRDRGFAEYLLDFFYYAAAGTARFDTISHILPAHISITTCSQYATTPLAGCSANYSSATGGAAAAARAKPATSARAPVAGDTQAAAPAARPRDPASAATGRLLGLVQQLSQSLTRPIEPPGGAGDLLNALAGYLLR